MTKIIPYLKWLVNSGKKLTTLDGKIIELWEFRHEKNDEILSSWAKHFRNHYCNDGDLDYYRKGYGFSRSDYLLNIKFPDSSVPPGPSIRSGDFAEILVADYLQYLLGYWVPRTRYADKTIRNESKKGTDVLGFKFLKKGEENKNDTLVIFETKAQFSGYKAKTRLQDAVDDSNKDQRRRAESLNAIKHRLFDLQKLDEAEIIERFQNPVDHPYKENSGAVALFSSEYCDLKTITDTTTNSHYNSDNLSLLVIHGPDMMKLVHDLFERAANEA